jgi:general stress protein 26
MPDRQPATWDEIVAAARRLGRNAFVASVDPRGRPHLAIVWIVLVDDVFHLVSDRASAKVRHLLERPAVAIHWQVSEEGPTAGEQLLVRGRAVLVSEPDARRALWDSGAWGDLGQYYQGAEDPSMAFLRFEVDEASIVSGFGGGPGRRWSSPSAG